jgi:hypothetical protein
MISSELSAGARMGARAPSACACILSALMMLAGCERDVELPSQLVVAIDTDMDLPDQVDELHLRIEYRNQVKFDDQFEVGAGGVHRLPATFTVWTHAASTAPVTVKLAGSKRGEEGRDWRTYREVTLPVPRDRSATLRMPIQWLCKGQAKAALDDSSFEPRGMSTCDEGYACRAGQCERIAIDEEELDDYRPEDVFGGGKTPDQGSCFDTVQCMSLASEVVPDADCTFPRPDGEDFNVALRVLNDGICDASGVRCFVPLDAESSEGWSFDGDRVKLPPAVCSKLEDGDVRGVLVGDSCAMKKAGVPTCGPWSDVPKGPAGRYRPEGSVMPSVQLIGQLPSTGGATPCCPLMAAEGKLYSCMCSSTSNATVFKIDAASGTDVEEVGALTPAGSRLQPLAASVIDGALYWAAENEVRRTPLLGSTALAGGLGVPRPSALYQTGSLLADAQNVYALASGDASRGDAVQLLVIARSGETLPLPVPVPVGDVPVFQFDHDEDAVYVARDHDEVAREGLLRTTSVLRIDKQNHERSVLLSERMLVAQSEERGGYVGVRASGGAVFALFEAVEDEGAYRVELHATPADRTENTDPQIIYAVPIDPVRTRLRLLGVADGGIVLVRTDFAGSDIAESAVIVVPRDRSASPRIVAGFLRDSPVDGLGIDDDRIYWLNASGKLYALARSILQ